MEPKDPKEPGADVVSIEAARLKAQAKDATGDPELATPATPVQVDANEFLQPVMAAIARELASVADPDGTVRVGGSDEASRAKTAAVVKGLGVGLGQALAEAFGKWAQKIEVGAAPAPVTFDAKVDPSSASPHDDDATDDHPKKPS
ncbi:MAG TPA: hypothetical protein VIA18_15645 [Polyangia bacterium]|nr:hypothetical protein [Polyangia bacterium]